jgi:hypothetical protein
MPKLAKKVTEPTHVSYVHVHNEAGIVSDHYINLILALVIIFSQHGDEESLDGESLRHCRCQLHSSSPKFGDVLFAVGRCCYHPNEKETVANCADYPIGEQVHSKLEVLHSENQGKQNGEIANGDGNRRWEDALPLLHDELKVQNEDEEQIKEHYEIIKYFQFHPHIEVMQDCLV